MRCLLRGLQSSWQQVKSTATLAFSLGLIFLISGCCSSGNYCRCTGCQKVSSGVWKSVVRDRARRRQQANQVDYIAKNNRADKQITATGLERLASSDSSHSNYTEKVQPAIPEPELVTPEVLAQTREQPEEQYAVAANESTRRSQEDTDTQAVEDDAINNALMPERIARTEPLPTDIMPETPQPATIERVIEAEKTSLPAILEKTESEAPRSSSNSSAPSALHPARSVLESAAGPAGNVGDVSPLSQVISAETMSYSLIDEQQPVQIHEPASDTLPISNSTSIWTFHWNQSWIILNHPVEPKPIVLKAIALPQNQQLPSLAEFRNLPALENTEQQLAKPVQPDPTAPQQATDRKYDHWR